MSPDQTLAQTWGRALGVSPDDVLGLMAGMQKVHGLIGAAWSELQYLHPGHRAQLIELWGQMEALPGVRHWDQQWVHHRHLVATPLPDLLLSAHHYVPPSRDLRSVSTLSRIRMRLSTPTEIAHFR